MEPWIWHCVDIVTMRYLSMVIHQLACAPSGGFGWQPAFIVARWHTRLGVFLLVRVS